MSELTEQATDTDQIKNGILAQAVKRDASGEYEFEGCTFNVVLKLRYEKNGEHGRGEYYKTVSKVQEPGEYEVQRSSQAFRDRGEAEEHYEELVDKYDLEVSKGDDPDAEEGEREPFGLLARLRARCGFCSGEEEEAESEDEE